MSAFGTSGHFLIPLWAGALCGWDLAVVLVEWSGCCSCWLEGWRQFRSELGELSEVLGGGCKQEFILRAAWASQSQSAELQDAFEMGKQHFHFLPVLS